MELASERLGITAKLDLLEGSDGGVVPIDIKKGRPTRDGAPWDADAVQPCAQVLLLREHGYTVERGEIFHAETRQRVAVEVTPELVARTMRIVGEARATATRLAPPQQPGSSWPRCGHGARTGSRSGISALVPTSSRAPTPMAERHPIKGPSLH